jgi:hypothetical protein
MEDIIGRMKIAPVRVTTGVHTSCKDVYLDPDVFYMAEFCVTDDKYPKYYIKLSHKYIPGCCIPVGSFMDEGSARDWLIKFLETKKGNA